MLCWASVFSNFTLPNAATWFYLSLILAIGLYFRFNRFFSLRNLDLISLYALVPGFLLIQQGGRTSDGQSFQTYGYIWLMVGSLYFFVRCLVDLALVSRPSLSPNVNLAGLAWLAGTLLLCLIPIAARLPADLQKQVGKRSAAIDVIDKAGSKAVEQAQQQLAGADAADLAATRFWVERSVALAGHLAVITALVLIGAVHFQNTTAGMAAATLYLLVPYTAFHVGQAHHVIPAALMIWAMYCYRRPTLAGVLIGLASGSFFFPILTVPLWLSFYGRAGWGRFVGSLVIALAGSLGLAAIVLWLDGVLADNLQLVLSLNDWQPWKSVVHDGIWKGVHGAYRLPIFIVYIAFVAATSFWPRPKNLAHLISLSAAVLIGIQFWYADHGGVYVLWYLPMMIIMVFRPNLADRFPPAANAHGNWPAWLAQRLFGASSSTVMPMAKV